MAIKPDQPKKFEFVVDSPGIRLDRYVAEQCQLSRTRAQKLIYDGQVIVNGHQEKDSYKPAVGDTVSITVPAPPPQLLIPEDIPLKIVYEDDDLIVIDKPAGLLVHPTSNQYTGTLVNALLARYLNPEGTSTNIRPGIVHRLDKDTSGLMMVARNDTAQMNLSHQIKQRSIRKGYIALVTGHLAPERGVIEAPVGRHPKDRKRMAVVRGGRESRTQYRVIRYIGGYTLLEAMPETGRTHQIRVHFSAIGHSIFGDPVYGKKSPLLGRQFLHASRLGFKLPSTREFVEFRSELPVELQTVLDQITDDST